LGVAAGEIRDQVIEVGRFDVADQGTEHIIAALVRRLAPLAGEPTAIQRRTRRACAVLAAAEASVRGVADQAHLSRQARALSGLTAKELFAPADRAPAGSHRDGGLAPGTPWQTGLHGSH
jgi:hypothetical protein